MRRVSLETLIKNPLTSMTLVFRFCYMSSVRSTSDGRGPVTRKRVPDREEPGNLKPGKDARRGRCHLLEAGLWPLWMTPLPRHSSHKSQVTRHPIAMASTAKPPDSMPCALAAILLPESRAHGCHIQNTMFPGPSLRAPSGRACMWGAQVLRG